MHCRPFTVVLATLVLATGSVAVADPPAFMGLPAALAANGGATGLPTLSVTGTIQHVDLQSGAIAVLAGPPAGQFAAMAAQPGQPSMAGPLVFRVDEQTQILGLGGLPGQIQGKPWSKKKRFVPPATQMSYGMPGVGVMPTLNKCHMLQPGQTIRVVYVGGSVAAMPGQFGKVKPGQFAPQPAPSQVPPSQVPPSQVPPSQVPPSQTGMMPGAVAGGAVASDAIAPPAAPDSSAALATPLGSAVPAGVDLSGGLVATALPGGNTAAPAAGAFAAPATAIPPLAGTGTEMLRAVSIEVLPAIEGGFPPAPGSTAPPATQPLPATGPGAAGPQGSASPA
ncbi:MAG: hypothetical protein KJZ87_26245 [Thermoguttaceae bacterium]|nr:hypothetical protein [Thermoguttaceae bacterium]